MRFTRIVALFLTLAVPCAAYAQQLKKPSPKTAAPQLSRPTPSVSAGPSRMSPEKAFYYFVAMYGFGRVLRDGGGPDDIIDIYGKSFDASNYARAMADEFERGRYKERIRARIADEVKKVDFNDKFTFVAEATLGEYSFQNHSFPFVRDMFQWSQFCIGPPALIGSRCEFLDVTAFRVQDAVNGNDFDWSLPMSENDASAFVKSRSTGGTGKIDRRIAVRITYSVVNKKGQSNPYFEKSFPIFSPFIYSVEAYGDKSLTAKLGVIPKINSLGPSTAEELRLAAVAAQTATKEIGKYQYIKSWEESREGLSLKFRAITGTITLTDAGIELSGNPQDKKSFFRLFALVLAEHTSYGNALETNLWRANSTVAAWGQEYFAVVWQPFWKKDYNSALTFERPQERDRFFVDLTHALQDWKTKYAPFQFAAGKVNIYEKCEVNTRFVPCSETTVSEGKPVWQTPSYKVTVESLERNGNDYVATLEFENLTDKTIKIAWQEKSGLVPDATGPYLIDESGEKYFVKGTDSGSILQDTMKYLWVALPEILPQAKLKSRFLFSGNGDGKMFTLKAKEMLQDLGTTFVTIDGLKLTSPSEVSSPSGTPGSGSSAAAPVKAPTAATSKTDDIYALGATQGTSVKNVQLVFAGKEDFESSGRRFTRYKFSVSNRSDFPDAMFERAPDLPPCGRNANASRSWVDLYNGDGERLNGFCALSSSDGLRGLWFALPQEEAAPDFVYIVINDRKLNRELKSNLVSTNAH